MKIKEASKLNTEKTEKEKEENKIILNNTEVAKRANINGAKAVSNLVTYFCLFCSVIFAIILIFASGAYKLFALIPALLGVSAFYLLYIKFADKINKYYIAVMSGEYTVTKDRIIQIEEKPNKKGYIIDCRKTGTHYMSKRDLNKGDFNIGSSVYIINMKNEKLNNFICCYYSADKYTVSDASEEKINGKEETFD